jgi:hypothetical protein
MTTVPRALSRDKLPAPMNSLMTERSAHRRESMQSLNIQSFSYADRNSILPNLTTAMNDCGGWVLDRKNLSPTTIEFHLEIHPRSIVDLYAALIASGLELTRAGHLALTALCTCRKNSAGPTERGHVVSIRLEISFLEDMTLQSLLMTGSALA